MTTKGVKRVYEKVIQSKQVYGNLKKCEIHLHTSVSHDYELIPGKKYKDLSIKDVLDYGLQLEYLNEENHQNLFQMVQEGEFSGDAYHQKLTEKLTPFKDFKEYFSYILIAHKLYLEEIEVVIITDHNTIAGFEKLVYASDEYFEQRIKPKRLSKKHIKILLGIEISCSDGNHVIAIFNEKKPEEAQKFVDDHILSESNGTFETSYTILQSIAELGGIGYIAHLNTSDFNGTGFYNRTLFGSEMLTTIGLTNLDAKGWISRVKSYTKRPIKSFCILYESDAHNIEDIGKRNTWIKFNKISFGALKKALIDFKVSVYVQNPTTTNSNIKGIIINPGNNGFLANRPEAANKDFEVIFSKDLNCIIGGRGTGKSTILNILDTVMTQEARDEKQLRFLSVHKEVFIVFTLRDKDYVVKFLPQVDNNLDMNHRHFFLEKAFHGLGFQNKDAVELPEHWLQLFEISKINEENYKVFEVKDRIKKQSILNNVYRKHYSINNIVSKVNNGKIGQFIKETIYYGINKDNYEKFLARLNAQKRNAFKSLLISEIPKLSVEVSKNQKKAKEKIKEFNEKNPDLIQIVYSPNVKDVSYYLREFWFQTEKEEKVANTILTWEDIEDYSYHIVEEIGLLKYIQYILQRDYDKLEGILKMETIEASKPISISDIEKAYDPINRRTLSRIYTQIINWILGNPQNIISSLRKYFEIVDDYSLNFNINSKEALIQNPVKFNNIESLSLGQQVVAILTFIIEYGKCSNDNTPLIIDQPEDNLDNQYIFKTLVHSLRNVKNTRQVIIVTHNSTIVTNADAEQVIVMDSDGDNGWVTKQGYLSDRTVMKYILVHLEGGEPAFKNKMGNYKTILNF